MAKSTPKPGRGVPPRAAAKSKLKSPAAEVDVAADKGGLGIDAGLAIFTTLVLLGALVCLDMLHAMYEHGMVFKP